MPPSHKSNWQIVPPAGPLFFFFAAVVFGGDKYLQAALKCGECVGKRVLLRKGPRICHGIAGSGCAFLILYTDKMHSPRLLITKTLLIKLLD
jgi:hypothetical protein